MDAAALAPGMSTKVDIPEPRTASWPRAETVSAIGPTGPRLEPANERQVRPLAPLRI
jgi:hypothetical protein